MLWLAASQGICIPPCTGSAVFELCSWLWKNIVKSKTKEWCPMGFMKKLAFKSLKVLLNTVGASVFEEEMQAKVLQCVLVVINS